MRSFLKALAVNAVVVVLLYFVAQDLIWRGSCATLYPPGCRASVSSISYMPFFFVYQVLEGGAALNSPLTLDWFQVLLAALVVFDALFVYRLARSRVGRGSPAKA